MDRKKVKNFMTNEQILKKAIEKAEKNGFQLHNILLTKSKDIEDEILTYDRYYAIIFSHDFAKAFTKGMEQGIIAIGNSPEITFEDIGEPYLWFLQQLVLIEKSEDRIKYLKKFL